MMISKVDRFVLITVLIRRFWKDMLRQTVSTQIRRRRMWRDQVLHCLPLAQQFNIHPHVVK